MAGSCYDTTVMPLVCNIDLLTLDDFVHSVLLLLRYHDHDDTQENAHVQVNESYVIELVETL